MGTAQQVPVVAWLSEPAASDVAVAGGKGANLAELTRAGLPVPLGFVVTPTGYLRALEAADMRGRIRRLLDEALHVDSDTPAQQERSERLRSLVRGAGIPDEVAAQVLEAYHRLGDRVPVAVRSSATAEDSAGASFAGMHASSLNVQGDEALLEGVRACWASLFGDRAVSYRSSRGLDEEPAIAVVVQRFVPADRAGVLFTADPLTGDPDTLVIEAALGLGDVVVGGEVQPDTYVVDRAGPSVRSVRVGHQTHRHDGAPDGTVVRTEIDPGEAGARVLDDDQVLALARWGIRVQEHFGTPQDIEWAMHDGRVHLVQSRPITSRGAPDAGSARDGEVLLHGLAASAGRASGRVRVLHDPLDGHDMADDDVLVAPDTNPDWVPTIMRAAAVVTDSGGMASHAAIVSRELGVPCVVGAGTATTDLRDGDLVIVDGSRGVVLAGGRPDGQSAGAIEAKARARSSPARRSASSERPTST